jgi:hypothetical protein
MPVINTSHANTQLDMSLNVGIWSLLRPYFPLESHALKIKGGKMVKNLAIAVIVNREEVQ